jgi:clan AA aspartic protease
MGLVYANITLVSIEDKILAKNKIIPETSIRAIRVNALVDSGAYFLAINERVQEQLGLSVIRKAPAALANGSIVDLGIVGPVEVIFENRIATVDAMVLPGEAEVLLGAIPMEAMDVLIDPRRQMLVVNPEHPIRPQYSLK